MATREQVVESWERLDHNIGRVAAELGISRSGVYHHLQKAGKKRPEMRGKVEERRTIRFTRPPKGEVRRYILSSAQNNTKPNARVWANLLELADFYGAEVLLGSITYDVSSYGASKVKRGQEKSESEGGPSWDPELRPYLRDDRIELAPGLVWCGEVNILPTAKNDPATTETYTQRASGIFPHPKFAMDAIPSNKGEATKFNWTTGAVTQRNYIQKKAGQIAEFHHGYGALLVEVDHRGEWWVRQLNADSDGRIYDLDVVVEDGAVYENEDGVEAITWGDIHSLALDPKVAAACWGPGGTLDSLKPTHQFFHDILLGTRINHHEWKNFHEQLRLVRDGHHLVGVELDDAASFLKMADRDWVDSVVVYSNHDDPWLTRWLNETDYRKDPANAETFLELQLAKVRAINGGGDVNLLELAMTERGVDGIRFLGCDESFLICRKRIECGQHGHLGPNGAKGTPLGLSKMGRKSNTAHTHSPGIVDGQYVAGTCTTLDMRFNRGPSSWSHSHVVTYPNGKRAIVTVWKGKWRAE